MSDQPGLGAGIDSLAGLALSAVIIGASTGGPPVLEEIVRRLPADFPVPVAVCQHMPPGFTSLWAERLDPLSALRVKEAEDGEPFVRGTVYIAPIGYQMRFSRRRRQALVVLAPDEDGRIFVPSIDVLMTSAAETFGSGTLGVLLSGLGSDGAQGMLAVRRAGGYTMIERPDGAVAASMPESAADAGAVIEAVATADLGRVIGERARGVITTR